METIACPNCHGKGKVPGAFFSRHPCLDCDGEGRIPAPPDFGETLPAFHLFNLTPSAPLFEAALSR